MAKYDVFISYSRRDTAVADKICAAFDSAGISYFIDRQGIAGGVEFPVVLADAIAESSLFLFLASKNSYDSKFTNSEITFAFNEKPKNTLLPYIIDGSTLPRGIKFIFSGINWRNIIDHPIETTLVADICSLLGRERKSGNLSADELYKRGKEYYNNDNFADAIPLLTQAAEMGYVPAYCILGLAYNRDYGIGKVYKNNREALKWFRKAAEHETRQPDKRYLEKWIRELEVAIENEDLLKNIGG